MTQRSGTLAAMALSTMLAGGSFCYGQSQQQQPDKPAVRDTLNQAQGQAVDRAGASDRATGQAQPAAAQQPGQHAGMPMGGGQQADQQVQQQLQKIAQQKDNMTGDRLFVLNAALHNQFEMALAQLAQQKAQDPQVKQLAQRIMQDHQQATQQLQPVAQKLQLDLPQGLTSMKQQELQVIGSLESRMFDQKFVCKMDELHAHDVAAFRNASQIAQSPDVKQFASQTLPKLQQHHQMVKQTGSAVGLSADDSAQPAGGRIPAQTPPSGGTTPGSDAGSTSPENRPNATRPPVGSNTPTNTDPARTGGPGSTNDNAAKDRPNR